MLALITYNHQKWLLNFCASLVIITHLHKVEERRLEVEIAEVDHQLTRVLRVHCATYLCHSQNMIILYLDHLVSWLLSFLSRVDQRQLRGRFQVQKLFYACLDLPCIDTIDSFKPFFFTIIVDDNIIMILNIAILVNININIMWVHLSWRDPRSDSSLQLSVCYHQI